MTVSRGNTAGMMLITGIVLLLCAPYPGFLGTTELRIIDLSLISILIVFILIGATVARFRMPRERFLLSAIFVLIGWQIVVILLSETSQSTVRDLLDIYKQLFWFTALVFGLMFSNHLGGSRVERAIEVAFLISSAVAVLQLIFGPSVFYHLFTGRSVAEVQSQFTVRVIGTLGNPNYFAPFNIAVFYWAVLKSMHGEGKRFAVYALLAFAMLSIAQSRTNIVGFLVLSLALAFVVFRAKWSSARHRAFFYRFVVFVVLAGTLLAWWMIEYGALRYMYTGFMTVYESGLASQNSVVGRLDMWAYFSELIKQRPVIGYGPSKGAFRYAVADNNYIFVTFRYGLIGLALTLLIWMTMLIRLLRKLEHELRDETVFAFFLLLIILFTSFLAETIDSMRLTPLLFLLCGVVFGRRTTESRAGKRKDLTLQCSPDVHSHG